MEKSRPEAEAEATNYQQTNSEIFNNGRSNRSETTESTNVRQQQGGGLLRRNSREQSATARKKPKFLTASTS